MKSSACPRRLTSRLLRITSASCQGQCPRAEPASSQLASRRCRPAPHP